MPRAPRTLADIPVPESSIQEGIVTVLRLDQWLVWETDKTRWHKEGARHPLDDIGAADLFCCRFPDPPHSLSPAIRVKAEVLFVECKRLNAQSAPHQKLWHNIMRSRGALVLVLGLDCEASISGFLRFYRQSGLQRNP